MHGNMRSGDIEAKGGVSVVYQQGIGGKPTTLSAEQFSFNGETGDVSALGTIRLEREEGVFLGDSLNYNFRQRTGFLKNAILTTDFLRAEGKTLQVFNNGSVKLENGTFTTCVRLHPDYIIHFHQITLVPNKYAKISGMSFYAGGVHLLTLHSYRYNFRSGSSAPTPLPGYNRIDGPFVGLKQNLLSDNRSSLDLNARVNLRTLPVGTISYVRSLNSNTADFSGSASLPDLSNPLEPLMDQFTPPIYASYPYALLNREPPPSSSFYAVLQNRQYVYNRLLTNLQVSRFPEAGVRMVNMFAHRNPDGAISSSLPITFNLQASMGEIQELPSNVTAGRMAIRADLATNPILLGRRISLRAGLSSHLSFYTTGTAYGLFSPEASLNYIPTRTSRIDIGYRYMEAEGRTPFLFDRRDIRNELRLQYEIGGPWAFGVKTIIDVDHSRGYDNEFAIVRNFDCMQVGVSYRTRTQQFGIIFNLLPPTPNREQRLLEPLQVK